MTKLNYSSLYLRAYFHLMSEVVSNRRKKNADLKVYAGKTNYNAIIFLYEDSQVAAGSDPLLHSA
jgi:hypothetical protein